LEGDTQEKKKKKEDERAREVAKIPALDVRFGCSFLRF
jgi:hypothetical protein